MGTVTGRFIGSLSKGISGGLPMGPCYGSFDSDGVCSMGPCFVPGM